MDTTWDATFEASPADTDEIKYGAGKIRELKSAVSERLEVEHSMTTGKHLPGKTSALYTGTTAEITALTGMAEGAIAYDETLGKLKIYTDGAWTALALGAFPAGTKMLFYQDVAPTGWTIENTLNDKLVFITKGSAAGGQTGGAVHSTGSWTISGYSGVTGGHSLTIAELAAHSHYHAHTVTTWNNINQANTLCMGGAGSSYPGQVVMSYDNTVTGSGSSHTHPLTHDGTWRPAAYSCIICTKD